MNQITLHAAAKLNFTLDITGIRPDGYHLLQMVMQTVSLYDTVTIRKADEISLQAKELATPENLVWKAAAAFFAHTGIKGGAAIQLEKKILGQLLKRKLVEESLEVLDAENSEDLITELADVLEVIDGILQQQDINLQEVLKKKRKKRDKVGGFERGIYLKKTSSSSASNTGKIIVEDELIDAEPKVSRSTDLRKYSTANESFTRVKVPVTVGKWEIKPNVKSHNVDIIIKGERKQGNLYVEISVFEQAEQLSLFTD